MDDRRFVHAVEFLSMGLICVQHGGVDERQALAAAPNRCFRRTAAAGEHVEDFAAPRRRDAGDPDGERIGKERFGGRAGRGRDAMRADPLGMRDDLIDDGVLHRAAPHPPAARAPPLLACGRLRGEGPFLFNLLQVS